LRTHERWQRIVVLLLGLLAAPVPALGEESIVAPAPLAPLEVPYPAGAHGDAEVVVELLVGEDGTVTRVTLREGAEPFAAATRERAPHFVFAPATRNGIPVRARIAVRIAFREPPPASEPKPLASELPSAARAPAAEPEVPSAAAAPPATEVTVLGEQRAELGSIHIPREEARRVPGAFGDPFRVVEVLPGVAPVLSGLPYYYVRGAPPGSVGYFIDGIRVPLLFHVGPGPSVITPLMIDRVDLFPGAYPARLGRFAGAILAGETATPRDQSRAEGQARIFDASAAVEQPLADGRVSALVGGRYSYTQAILAAVAPDYSLGYGDYQARLGYAASNADRLTVFAFGGYDFLRNEVEARTLFDVVFHRVDLRWDRVLAAGRFRLGVTLSDDRVFTQPDDVDARSTVQKSTGLRVRAEYEQELAPSARVRAGADLGAERVRGDVEDRGDSVRAFPTRTDITAGAYADLIWRPARSAELVPGVRVDQARSRGADYTFVDPRLGTRARLFPGVSHLGAFGIAHQLPAVSTRMSGVRPTLLELSRQESVQAMQGIEYALPDGMLGRTTLFYQHVDVEVPGIHGRSFGLEQFLRRDFTHRLGGFLSYTLSRAEGVTGSGIEPSGYDRTHVITAVLGYDLGSGYRVGGRGYFASGRPAHVECPTPDCGPGDPMAPYVYARRVRLPSFLRLDLRAEKRWTFPSGLFVTATLEWFNALLATEVVDIEYTRQGLVYERQSALTLPSIGVEFGW
jgi:hypothetical protein